MEIDYKWWQTKEEIRTFIEENEVDEEAMSAEMVELSKTNTALMSLVTFFAFSKLFQLRKRVGEAGGAYSDEEGLSKYQKKGELRDDHAVRPTASEDKN